MTEQQPATSQTTQTQTNLPPNTLNEGDVPFNLARCRNYIAKNFVRIPLDIPELQHHEPTYHIDETKKVDSEDVKPECQPKIDEPKDETNAVSKSVAEANTVSESIITRIGIDGKPFTGYEVGEITGPDGKKYKVMSAGRPMVLDPKRFNFN